MASVIQYFFLQLGIKKTSAFTASMFQYVGPVFAGLISVPLLHEKPSMLFLIGGLIIIFGVFYATTFDNLLKYLKKK
jgi:drug/metabolite transporter (DMT)-like permease